MNGKGSIFHKWAEFSVNASKEPLAIERVIGKVLISPITDRDVHIHLIPRFSGDMADPEGGVRGVIPEKRKYLP